MCGTPCTEDCNQGRDCPKRKQAGFTGVEIAIFVMALSGVVTALLPLFESTEPVCRAGYLYDSATDTQIISEKGGGIPCEVI